MINEIEIVKLFGVSVIASIFLLIVVFATGQTFGQRCAKEYKKDTIEWCDCVERVSQGGQVIMINTKITKRNENN